MQTPLGSKNNSKRFYISPSADEQAANALFEQTFVFAMNANEKLKRIVIRNLAVPNGNILFNFPDTPILKDILISTPGVTFWDDVGNVVTPTKGIVAEPATSTNGYSIIEIPIGLSVNGSIKMQFQMGTFAVSYVIDFEVEP